MLVLPLAALWLVEATAPDAYHRLIPEDGVVEWGTFWAQVVSLAASAWIAWRARSRGLAAWWFPAGVALFSFFVAGEEVSWGQRVFGYQPPSWFLHDNIQLEANIHNLFRPRIWSAGIELVIAGYGIVLPLLLRSVRVRTFAERFGIYAPPATWIPGFTLALAAYVTGPYLLCEEVVELAIALGLAMTATNALGASVSRTLAAAFVALVLGVASADATGSVKADPALVAEAGAEVEALRDDFVALRKQRGGEFLTDCDLQTRLASMDREAFLLPLLKGGAFHGRVAGASSKRAEYLLDPWNMPYWISDLCDSASRYILIYSYGPDRRRDTNGWQTGGDDIGAWVFRLGTPRPGDWQEIKKKIESGEGSGR